MSSKASVDTSVKTIVILVVALVVLGLAIAFIRTVFFKADLLPGLIDLSTLSTPPTKDNPLVLFPSELTLAPGKLAVVSAGVYNDGPQRNLGFSTVECKKDADALFALEFRSLCTTVGASQAVGYRVILQAARAGSPPTDLSPGSYVCTMKVRQTHPAPGCGQLEITNLYSKQFILNVQ